MRERILPLLIIMIATAFFGELKMNPFGESFRFSLGIAAYFFGLLWFRSLSPLVTGFVVGTGIFLFRLGLDVWFYGLPMMDRIPIHAPSAFYYYIFALVVHVARLKDTLDFPLRVGVIGGVADVLANFAELFIRFWLGQQYPHDGRMYFLLILFGSLRSFFVVGLYNMLMIRQVRAVGAEQESQLERLLLLNAGLYEEGLYLQKSMSDIEDITRNSYSLYKDLRYHPALADQALSIAEKVHEVKKDSQRILAGISKLIGPDILAPRIQLSQLIGMATRANINYAEMLGKQIDFTYSVDLNLSTNQIYPLLSVLNNLIANAVEAIEQEGTIHVQCELDGRDVIFTVRDNGPGIPSDEQSWVFLLGYTTKYDSKGNPSTGIGLCHMKDNVESLGGSIELTSHPGKTIFVVRVPSRSLLKQEVEE